MGDDITTSQSGNDSEDTSITDSDKYSDEENMDSTYSDEIIQDPNNDIENEDLYDSLKEFGYNESS